MLMEMATHPGEDDLYAYRQGKLDAGAAAAIEEHLSACDTCCDVLERTDDSFIGRLRCMTEIARADEIPAELVDHPRYRVLRLLGRGGMGAVYLAEHLRMGRQVALKIIHPELLRHPAALARFQQEVRAAARLDHPNIVISHDADQAGGLHFLVMEHVDGRNLADHLAEHGPLPVHQACDIIRQAALGLEHAHRLGMIHRDIKPHNLMLTATGQVKVLDFGLALLKEEGIDMNATACERERSGIWEGEAAIREGEAPAEPRTRDNRSTRGARQEPRPLEHPDFRLTRTGAVMGTVDYVAPEQARDPRRADGRADVYSLGCTLYQLISGHVPFPGGDAADKLTRLAEREPISLTKARPDVPEEIATVVQRMLAKRPEDRYATPVAVAQALAPFTSAMPRRSRFLRRAVLGVAMLAVMAAAAFAAGVVRLPLGNDRELVIETDDPAIEVIVKGERIVRIVDPKNGKAYKLDRENLSLSLADDPDGLSVTLDGKTPIVLRREGKRIATVRLVNRSEMVAGNQTSKQTHPAHGDLLAKTGFRLFNRKDLIGWHVENIELGRWSVEGDAIVGRCVDYKSRNYLLTKDDYADFTLKLEYMLEAGSAGGVVFRAVEGKDIGAPSSCDHPTLKLTDPAKYPNYPSGTTHWVRNNKQYDRPAVFPELVADVWHALELTVRGDTCVALLDGKNVVDVRLDPAAGDIPVPALRRTKGRIGFQAHTGTIRFRRVQIKELPPVAARAGGEEISEAPLPDAAASVESSFFNGKNLFGWQGLPGYWKVHNGAIVGAPADGVKAHTFLCSERTYKDFELKFKVRRKNGVGNSGLQIRSRISDRERFTVVGPQIEIDSATFRNPPGSVVTEPTGAPRIHANAAAIARVWKDDGFNAMTVRCVGKHVTVTVNGVVAVDADLPTMPAEGIIALQLHGGLGEIASPEEVVFKDIQFKELSGDVSQPRDRDLTDVVEKDRAAFDGLIRARHIVIRADDEAAREQLLALKKQILFEVEAALAKLPANVDAVVREKERIKALDQAFATLAGKVSKCPSKSAGGDIGWFPRTGTVHERFARAAFALKPFELSDPVATNQGYHLIVVVERKPGPLVPGAGLDHRSKKEEAVADYDKDFLNRKHFRGWRGLKRHWTIKDGAIVGFAESGQLDAHTFLCSNKRYRDFELKFQVRLDGRGWAGNSGVQIRSTLIDSEKFIVQGPQCDIGDGYWGSLYGERTGGMMKQAPRIVDEEKVKRGAFIDYFIRCVGKHVTIEVNGQTTVDDEFVDLPDEGIIAWQLHSGGPMTVTFRNIQFKEVFGDTSRATRQAPFGHLFNGKDLAGWSVDGKGADAWRVEDGELVTSSEGYLDSAYLLSEKSYADFRLRLEYRLSPGANSGVALRAVPGEREPRWNVPHHLEVQILDDAKHRKADGTVGSPTGAIYWSKGQSILRPDRLADLKPAGQWNEMFIELRGDRLRVWVNGDLLQDTYLSQVAKLPEALPGLRRNQGRIGLQRHSGEVRFRKVWIEELPAVEETSTAPSVRSTSTYRGPWQKFEKDEKVQRFWHDYGDGLKRYADEVQRMNNDRDLMRFRPELQMPATPGKAGRC